MTTVSERPAAPPQSALPPSAALTERPDQVRRSLSNRTAEDWTALLGAYASSLAVTWILYEQILPFSGKIGFVLAWYGMFIALYSLVTSLNHPRPVVVDRIASALVQGGAAVILGALLATLIFVIYKGYPAWHLASFYTQDGSRVGPTTALKTGGMSHALVGTGEEIGIAVLISLPLGLITAIYMTEVRGPVPRLVRTVVEAMTALPDLVAGLFVYAILVVGFHMQRDGFAAALALSITMLPIIARSSEVVLRVVPGGLREASLALGASRWRTSMRVVLPTARPGLATALILGVARGIGETAPLLIVSGESNFFNKSPFDNPMNSLPLYAYQSLRSGQPLLITRGYGAATVLLAIVGLLFIVVRLIARQRVGRS